MFSEIRQPPFLGVPRVAFTDSLLVALERAGLLAMKKRCTALMRFCGSFSQMVYRVAFNSSVVL